jgi:hypothetical protein
MPPINGMTVAQALMAAQGAGRAAADAALQELERRHGQREQYDVAAGAVLHLSVRPTSRIARELERVCESLSWIARVFPGDSGRELTLAIAGMSIRQDQCINIAAQEAALAILSERLGVMGFVTSVES